MKRALTLIACVAICSAMTVSCKNNKKSQNIEPTQEEIQQQKQELADTVWAEIDALAERYIDASKKSFRLQVMELTDAEKMLKPDYLLDLSVANNLVTKSQKISALAIYIIDAGLRKIYDMPTNDIKETIAKIAAEVDFPIDMEYTLSNSPVSEKTKGRYEVFKERGELATFWQFEYAIISEIDYIIANNPDLYFSKITEEQWQSFYTRKQSRMEPIKELAKYDQEKAQVYDFINQNRIFTSQEDRDHFNQTKDTAKQYCIDNKEIFISRRNALLE